MLNLKRKTKIVLACSVLLSLLFLSSWSLLDINAYNLDFGLLKTPKAAYREEICRPYKDIVTDWDYPASPIEHYPRINEIDPNGIRIGNSGFDETKTDIFELTSLNGGEEVESIESITICIYCTCWAGQSGVSKLKVSYQLCLNDEWSDWSSEKLVSSTFSWRWKTFTWDNFRIKLHESTTITLRVKLVSYIKSRRYGGDIYVDTLKAELKFTELDWGVDAIDAEEVWGGYEDASDVSPCLIAGEGVNLCIIDSGIDICNLDLFCNYKGGYDFYEMDTIPQDIDGHGTHVAGIVGAIDNDFGVIGVAPKVNLYVCRHGEYDPEISNVINAIMWAIDNNMDIISMSFSAESSPEGLEAAIEAAHLAGIILVACSGFYDTQKSPYTGVHYPGKYPNVIAVGALKKNLYRWWDHYEEEGQHYFFGSPYGGGLDISAPGVSIQSTCCGNIDGGVDDEDGIVNGYAILTGTSMACPMVAGVCALILSVRPDLTPAQVEECICKTAEKVGYGVYDQTGVYGSWDDEYGYGMVNATAAVNYAIYNITIS